MQSESKTLNVKELVLMGLMIALVYLAGSIIKIPSIGGFVHIGDCMVFLSVILLGKKKGAISSALGMFLVDVLGGYYLWAPFTLIIKGTMAYISGYILERIKSNNSFINNIIAFAVSGVFMIIGYFIAGTIMAGLLTEKAGIIQGLIYASKDIVGNIIQVTTGVVIALPLSEVLIKAKKAVLN
ncbi:ECF transporter S component [Clostridium botulinum]|uniref:ECF transporter S component n=1 Tax=Clostridium botulinum TaxID=1491 RepID=UPI00077322FD|nr:ECF transporter S component [Clostridium botulinum]NFL85440.1 ECF transporter S component [Clostridium botulinum]NFO20398.1 ECF transporter S component [Clostridium botulinum]